MLASRMSTGSVQDITSPTTTTTTTAIKKTLLPPLKKGVMVDIDDIKPNNGVIVSTPTTTTTTTTNAVGVNGSAHHRTSPPTLNLKPSSIVSSGVAPAADLYDKYFLRPVDWALLRSCEAGDVEDVYQSLWAGASINCRKPIYNLTPLCIAVQRGYSNIVSVLLEFGAKIDLVDSYGATAFHWVANNNNTHIFQMLLQKWETTAPLTGLFGGGGGGGGLQMSGGGGADALFRMSMFSKSTDSVQITLSRSIVNRRDVFGSTPLHFASAKGCGDVVGLLIKAGSDVNITNNDSKKASDVTLDEDIKRVLVEEEQTVLRAAIAARKKATKSPKGSKSGNKKASSPARGQKSSSATTTTQQQEQQFIGDQTEDTSGSIGKKESNLKSGVRLLAMKKLTASKQKTQSKVEDVDDASNVMLVETNSLSRSSNDRLKNVAVVHI